ncbi:response regulator transcription factor [Desulfogranum mediterraneum]|uniref:response regulator transcription factor n=1 Tax=Desulfogranum mediterraneum TaxID=160661 RepID=UPI000427293E|nr:response regulator transcription factor [Desulfogranum mediterraneum]
MPPSTILLVDDHSLIRQDLKKALAGSRYRVIDEAADGVEALKKADEHKPDIVLTNIRMPALNGLELLAALKKQADPPRVIICTMMSNKGYLARAQSLGADGYIDKVCLAGDTPRLVLILDEISGYPLGHLEKGMTVINGTQDLKNLG